MKDILKWLQIGKASGGDIISHQMLKNTADTVYLPLKYIFNHSLRVSKYPSCWKIANVLSLLKKGGKSIASNYRPIALLGIDHLTWRGGYGLLFRSEFFIRTTQELEYLFFLSRRAQIFVPVFNIRLYDKNSESDFFFFLHQNQNILFSNIGKQNIFFRKRP